MSQLGVSGQFCFFALVGEKFEVTHPRCKIQTVRILPIARMHRGQKGIFESFSKNIFK
jgi:hypothetical protein